MVDEFSEVSVYPALTVFQSAGLELSGQRLLMWVRQTLRLGTVNIDTVQQLCASMTDFDCRRLGMTVADNKLAVSLADKWSSYTNESNDH